MTTPLQLDAYVIDRLQVDTLENFDDGATTMSVHTDVDPTHLLCNEDPAAHQLRLKVVFGPSQPGSAPYSGEIVGRAFFHVSDDLNAEDTARYILLNGSAILFGLLRAQVAQVCALGRWGAFLLPPVNFVEALEQKAEAGT